MSAGTDETRIPNWKKIIYFIFHTLFIFLLGTGFIFAHDMVTKTKEFPIKKIKITGNHYLGKEEIKTIAGFFEGDNIFGLNISMARLKLENNQWIKNAKVKRILPDVLEVEITEEKPLAKISLKENFIINEQGHLFKKYENKDKFLGIPEVTGLNYSDFINKNHYYSLIMETLKTTNILFNTNSRLHLDKDIGITLYNTDSFSEILIGFTDLEKKIKSLSIVKLYLKKKFNEIKIEKINLSNKNRVVLKPFPAMG
ncbi:MAG: FtsQ-type POTRA domain-containing protein [Desulforegulaceae bacterium]|nr:FtsQ-type POTRA domain-containing protein [Desulforegulaceae bacterium]